MDLLPWNARTRRVAGSVRGKRWIVAILSACCVAANASSISARDVGRRAPSPARTNGGYYEPAVPVEIDANAEYERSSDEEGASAAPASLAELQLLNEQIAELRSETEALKKSVQDAQAKKLDPNGPFTFKFGGQVIMDSVGVSQGDDNKAFLGDVDNQIYVRGARFTMDGSGYGNLEYSFGMWYNNGLRLENCYLRYKDAPYLGDLTVGHFRVESGMESVTPVIEKSYAAHDDNALFFRMSRRLGVSSVHYGTDKRTRAFLGVFLAPAITVPPYDVVADAPGVILNARLTGTPIYRAGDAETGEPFEVLHIGGSHYWLGAGDETSSIQTRTRGLAWSGSTPYFIDGKFNLDGRSYSVSEVEAAWARGGFAATSDLFCSSVEDGGNAFGATVGGRWFLTPGCWRKYSLGAGRFGGAQIAKDALFIDVEDRVVGQHWGGWEVLSKWGWTEANNLKDVDGARYGTVNRLTVGLNWWWNEKTYWTFNWERAFLDVKQGARATDSSVDTLIMQTNFKF